MIRQMSLGYNAAAVSELSDAPIPAYTKGFSADPDGRPITGSGLAERGTTLFDGDLSFPLLTVRDSAVSHNIAQLARFTADHDVLLAPHAKTTMAPQLFARQLEAGAWGLTAATISQVMLYRQFGVGRVLLANELVDPQAIRWLAEQLSRGDGFEFHCYVDSLAGIDLLDRALGAGTSTGSRLNVLVELGFDGGRTGARSIDDARALARAAAKTSTLAVTGVAGYEGGLGSRRESGVLTAVRAWCADLVKLSAHLQDDGLLTGPGLISAGGSGFPDLVVEALSERPTGTEAILRSGSYITHDDGMYEELSPFTSLGAYPDYALEPALELWARVLSVPEPSLALVDFGRRDAGFDHRLPVPKHVHRQGGPIHAAAPDSQVLRLNDQHAYLQVTEALSPGDLVGFGISHPCTTFDRWRHPVLLDDGYRVLDVLTTYF
jgi:D-serine deaminase-like pyridoxal phosphate-dependent protein